MTRRANHFFTRIAFFLLCATGANAWTGSALAEKANDADIEKLRQMRIAPTVEGITNYFKSLIDGNDADLKPIAIDRLIKQLGSNDFRQRQEAVRKLAALDSPPLDKLEQAAKGRDLEVAMRAKQLLSKVQKREDPRAAVFRVMQKKKLRVDLPLFLEIIARCQVDVAFDQACRALAAIVIKEDAPLVKKSLLDPRVRVKAAAVRALAKVLPSDDAIKELEILVGHDQLIVRAAAVRALLDAGKTLDAESLAKRLDIETLIVVLRAEERQFRHQHKDDRGNREMMQQYQQLLNRYAEALAKSKDTKQVKKRAARNKHFFNLRLDTSKHPEILMYRIRWFSGRWSGWFVPGFNDKETGKGRNVRHWGCFNDHEHLVISTTDKSKYREILDLR